MAKVPKKKKEKKEKRARRPRRVPLPKAPLTARDVLVSIVAYAFLGLSLMCMILAIESAMQGDGQSTVRRASVRPAPQASTAGSMWFGLPDGSFVNEYGDPFVAPPPVTYQPPAPRQETPAAPEPTPVPEAAPPEVPAAPETPAQEMQAAPAPVSNGQDWTVMVWIAQRGGRYHSRNDCPQIGSAAPREATIQEAVALDCTRCESCWQD